MKLRARAAIAAAVMAAAASAACHHAPAARVMHATAHAEIALPDGAPTALAAIVELGDAVIVLAGTRVTVLRGRAIAAAVDAPQPWTGGTTIAAPDGEGRWAVGVAADGSLWHITLAGELEPIADRLGLAGAHARVLGGAGMTTAASIDGGIAASIDGVHLARIDRAAPVAFAVARGHLALATPLAVESWDLAAGTFIAYPIRGVTHLAYLDAAGEAPRIALASDRVLYVESHGALRLVTVPAPIRAIAAAGARLWIDTRGALFAIDGDTVERVDGAAISGAGAAASLFGSPTGDVWTASAHGITRYALSNAESPAELAWQANVAPVFQRVCAHCHLPGGDAGVDLSTPASWVGDRDELRRRVLVTQTMPPAGSTLTDDDRAALAAWLGAK